MKRLRTFLMFLLLSCILLTVNTVSVQADTNADANQAVIVANSVDEFSGTQGKDNWYYGYKDDQLIAPFEEMKIYNTEKQVWLVKPGTYKTRLFAGGGFPNAIEPSGKNVSAKQFPVRRWISEVDGDITINGVLKSKSQEKGGDGVKGYILVNDQRIWSGTAKDSQPVRYKVTATVKKGDAIDLAVASKRNDAFDRTRFIAKIYGTPSAIAPDAIAKGAWEIVPLPADKKDWMQAVATALLPNGKVLIANGSANRNTLVFENGQAKFLDGVNSSDYETVNNTLLFDPTTNEFERIDSPPPILEGDSNDLFCGAQVQMLDGNILFISGTNRYYPGESFEGSKQSNLYQWKDNSWSTLGQMKEGRWYPSLVPLKDGKIAIFSGLKFGKPGQITPTVEIYDPAKKKFHYIDLTEIEDSPFNTKIEYHENGVDVNSYDGIDVYPRVFPTSDGRILITGDGAGRFPLALHASKKAYLMTINEDSNGDITSETVKFDITPERAGLSRVYGTGLLDPNRPGDTLLIGGLLGTNDLNMGRPFDPAPDPNLPDNPRVARSLEHWISPEHSGTQNGKWEVFEDFLDQPRAMNMGVILPSKEILVVNGGQYGEYKPTYEPTLMTFDPNSKGSYKTAKMNPAKLPRLYHNSALLLPDARVLAIGGNVSRSARLEDGTVRIDVVPNPPKDAGFETGYYQIAELVDKEGNDKTFDVKEYLDNPQDFFVKEDVEAYKAGNLKELLPFVPAEIRQAEIFSPPYLFKPGARPKIVQASATLKYGQADTISVKDATQNGSIVLAGLGSTTHSLDYGQRLAEAKITSVALGEESLVSFTAPDNANLYPPGYYMMFYVNDIGKPSEAKMVKLEG